MAMTSEDMKRRIESELVRKELMSDLMQEADEILAIVVASLTTSRGSRA